MARKVLAALDAGEHVVNENGTAMLPEFEIEKKDDHG
jgi:hypothetical protein